MGLRIIGGSFRNRLLKSPKGNKTRPTSALLRKAVFDICQADIQGAHFLDLYAGTGAMGLEALSRGAQEVTFVDNYKNAIQCIQENVKALQAEPSCHILCQDALRALPKLQAQGKSFSIIYVDPPYAQNPSRHNPLEEILLFLSDQALWASGGILFIEEAFPPTLKEENSHLQGVFHKDSRQLGSTLLHQYRKVSAK